MAGLAFDVPRRGRDAAVRAIADPSAVDQEEPFGLSLHFRSS
jgi:hypothetical protein